VRIEELLRARPASFLAQRTDNETVFGRDYDMEGPNKHAHKFLATRREPHRSAKTCGRVFSRSWYCSCGKGSEGRIRFLADGSNRGDCERGELLNGDRVGTISILFEVVEFLLLVFSEVGEWVLCGRFLLLFTVLMPSSSRKERTRDTVLSVGFADIPLGRKSTK